MISGTFYQGSGLGNQLHRYVATRVLALDKGYEWGMAYVPDGSGKPEGFKGASFMPIDLGKPVEGITQTWNEKKVTENGIDIRGYDPEFNFVQDNTTIDGEFQDERYFGHRMKEIDEWLKVKHLRVEDNTCVIGFRGGEFTQYPDLFLTRNYWDTAIALMKERVMNCRFEVHTDDPVTAQAFFPDYPVIHDMEINWRSMRYAKNAIIANSSFYIFPRLLSGGYTIAPRFWARRNIQVWATGQNYYKSFYYL